MLLNLCSTSSDLDALVVEVVLRSKIRWEMAGDDRRLGLPQPGPSLPEQRGFQAQNRSDTQHASVHACVAGICGGVCARVCVSGRGRIPAADADVPCSGRAATWPRGGEPAGSGARSRAGSSAGRSARCASGTCACARSARRTCQRAELSIYLSIHLSIYPSIYLYLSISAAYLPACRARGLPCMFAGLRRSYAQALVWACARLLSPRQACSPTHSIGIGSAQSLPSTAKPYSVGPIATHARGPQTRRSQRQRARRSVIHTHIANGQHGLCVPATF